MKVFALSAFLIIGMLQGASCQISYHHYLDYSVQWDEMAVRQEMNSSACGSTSPDYLINYHMHTYIAGDTAIGGRQYYRMMTYRTDSAQCATGAALTLDTVLYLRYYLREDSDNRMYQNLNGLDTVLWDFNIAIGDSFPNCKLGWMDTVWLGATALKRWHCNCFAGGVYSSVIEGVGTSSGFDAMDWMCSLSVDSSIALVCYARQSYMLQTDTAVACNLVPTPTAIDEPLMVKPLVWPNPTTGELFYRLQEITAGGAELAIYNMLGQVLRRQALTANHGIADLSALPAGVYVLCFSAQGQKYVERVVKQ